VESLETPVPVDPSLDIGTLLLHLRWLVCELVQPIQVGVCIPNNLLE
jgi:hypothetical protein